MEPEPDDWSKADDGIEFLIFRRGPQCLTISPTSWR